MQFPAMRRLSIANANAFLLVYRFVFNEMKKKNYFLTSIVNYWLFFFNSIDSEISFEIIKQCFEEIKEIRTDFQVSFDFFFWLSHHHHYYYYYGKSFVSSLKWLMVRLTHSMLLLLLLKFVMIIIQNKLDEQEIRIYLSSLSLSL